MDSTTLALIVGGGVTACFVIIQTVIPKIVEQSFQKRFEKEIKLYQNGLDGDLERRKNNLAVWYELRKDILAEKWEHHKRMINEMTGVILSFQARVHDGQSLEDTIESVNLYRIMVHKSYALIPMEGIIICDEFYQECMRATAQDDCLLSEMKLKQLRNKMCEYTDSQFLMSQMMSGIAQETVPAAVKN